MLHISHQDHHEGESAIIKLNGALDSNSVEAFENYINTLIDNHRRYFLIDAAKLEYISSIGIGALLYMQKKVNTYSGFMVFSELNREITALFNFLGFDKNLIVTDSYNEARELLDHQLKVGHYQGQTNHHNEKEEPAIQEINVASATFDNPLIIECASCRSLIRVPQSGRYMCPDCKTQFSVNTDQSVVF